MIVLLAELLREAHAEMGAVQQAHEASIANLLVARNEEDDSN